MNTTNANLILGEYRRTLDDRHRVAIPPELLSGWPADSVGAILAKERPGCLSLWHPSAWQGHLEAGIRVVESKLAAGRLGDRIAQVQMLGRLLSTRHREVKLAGRGRLAIPEGFREFLGGEPNSEVMVIGAAVCIEIWRPEAWLACLNDQIPQFSQILDDLSG